LYLELLKVTVACLVLKPCTALNAVVLSHILGDSQIIEENYSHVLLTAVLAEYNARFSRKFLVTKNWLGEISAMSNYP
jgi:hypothetical protein